ncbi:MAG: hypothetical protein K0Q49_1799 [Haloplasmataceae bacterium]|jgi:hypothetical protein|nr:hypothetical protein [Haloplasmataceae bacterium]
MYIFIDKTQIWVEKLKTKPYFSIGFCIQTMIEYELLQFTYTNTK